MSDRRIHSGGDERGFDNLTCGCFDTFARPRTSTQRMDRGLRIQESGILETFSRQDFQWPATSRNDEKESATYAPCGNQLLQTGCSVTANSTVQESSRSVIGGADRRLADIVSGPKRAGS